MIPKSIERALLGAVLALLASTAQAQVPPQPVGPNPTSESWLVELNGQVQEGEVMEFYNNGTWKNFDDNKVWGWGIYEWDPTTGTINYINLSGDGGGHQCGTYTWSDTNNRWERTYASHPQAPPLNLLPPPA